MSIKSRGFSKSPAGVSNWFSKHTSVQLILDESFIQPRTMSTEKKNREDFWAQYYAGKIQGDSELVELPSPFAVEVLAKLDSGCSLLDIGCGNGRDSSYFASNNVVVVATDICEIAVDLTANRLPKNGCKAMVASAKDLPDDINVDYAYARFVLHALTEDEQSSLFAWLKTHVKKKIFIETRSVNDPRCGKGMNVGFNAFVDTHYRRFMSPVDLQTAATEVGIRVEKVEDTIPGSGNDGARVVRATLIV